MKAVVVEIRDGYAAVLSDDGQVTRVKNKNYELGQMIQLKTHQIPYPRKLAAFTASAAAFLLFGVSAWAYAAPYTYVSVDINPSVEYTLNRFDRVISVQARNDDGEEILDKISLNNLKNKPIEEAIKNTVHQISESGYFDNHTDNGIVIATASEDEEKADLMASDLKDTAEEEIAKTDDKVAIESYPIGLDRVEEAQKLGVTPGKLNLVEKLQSSAKDPAEIDIKEWLEKPVRDILKATKENHNTSAAKEDSDSSAKDQSEKKSKDAKVKSDTTSGDKVKKDKDKEKKKTPDQSDTDKQNASDNAIVSDEETNDTDDIEGIKSDAKTSMEKTSKGKSKQKHSNNNKHKEAKDYGKRGHIDSNEQNSSAPSHKKENIEDGTSTRPSDNSRGSGAGGQKKER